MGIGTTDRILITGAFGFLGRHLRLRLLAQGYRDVVAIGRAEWNSLEEYVEGVDVVFHLAGINRADDQEVVELGNRILAEQLRAAFGDAAPSKLVFANSIHADADSPYGRGKSAASNLLSEWMHASGGSYTDVRLPNLFGEHGRPYYNSFVATFVELVVTGGRPTIEDREVPLYAQQAAQALIEAASGDHGRLHAPRVPALVSDVWEILVRQHALYSTGIIPDISDPLARDLFNTLRARMFIDRPQILLRKNTDHRGTFVETVRATGGQGQTSYSTSAPGVTRGNHFHLRRVERFIVLAGTARISVAQVFGTDPYARIDLAVDGDSPVAVDMPTGWAHSITNVGDEALITQFWISEMYDRNDPDTVHSVVTDARSGLSAE